MRPSLPTTAHDDLIALARALTRASHAHLHLEEEGHALPFDLLVREAKAPVALTDLAADPRFRDHFLVRQGPRYGAYLGVPVLAADGACRGVLGVFDGHARPFSKEDSSALERLARLLLPQLEKPGVTADENARLIAAAYEVSPFASGIVELTDDDILQLSQNAANVALIGRQGTGQPFLLRKDAGVPAAQVAAWRAGFLECLRQRRPLTFEHEQTLPDGSTAPKRTYINALPPGPSGAPRFMFKTLDTSEERRKDEALREQQKLTASIASHVGLTIWVRDVKAGGLVFVSPYYEEMWGRPCASLLADNRSFLDGVHPDDRAEVMRAFDRMREGAYELTYRVITPTGTQRWVKDMAYPVHDASGKLVQLIGVVSDVTEERRRERELVETNENLEVVLTHLPVALSVFDESGRRIRVNREWERVTGWPASVVGGHDVLRGMFEQPEDFDVARRFVHSSNVLGEFAIRTQAGERKEVAVTMVPLPSGKKVSLTRDLTYERAQTKMIEDQRQSLIEAARFSSLGEMAAGIAHEINNPLAIIQGSAQLLLTALERGKIDEEKVLRSVERIDATVTRIAKIISGLRSFARDGRQDPLLLGSIKTIVDESLELCQTRFRNNGVELVLDFPEHAETIQVRCRPTQLSQVIINLLNNAFDAVTGQEMKQLRIRLREEDGSVVLQVLDSGPGVPAALREKIMQPFFTTKAPGKGTGLGLSLSRSIVEKHRGTLVATTFEGLTSFEIRLPRAQEEEGAA